MTTPILLILLGTLARLAPHPPNATALGALALYAGARLPRRWAILVPLAAMVVSDIWLDWGTGRPAFDLVRLSVYGSFIAIALLGGSIRTTSDPWIRSGMAAVSSCLFFVVTNFAFWYVYSGRPDEPLRSGPGLAMTYVMALPFFTNMLIADVVGTAVLFGLDGASRRIFAARSQPAALAR